MLVTADLAQAQSFSLTCNMVCDKGRNKRAKGSHMVTMRAKPGWWEDVTELHDMSKIEYTWDTNDTFTSQIYVI